MTEKLLEKRLFLVRSTLSIHPSFYVEAVDIVDATKKSKLIVDYFVNKKVVVAISTIDIPLLDYNELETT